MTEREKMLAGMPYDTSDKELAVGNPCRVIRQITEKDRLEGVSDICLN